MTPIMPEAVPPKDPCQPAAEPNARPYTWSLVGLIAGILALGLAAIPPVALGRPLTNPFEPPEAERKQAGLVRERDGGLTLRFKGLSINVGGKAAVENEAADPIEVTKDPIRWFTIAAIGCALIGLLTAAFAQLRERHTVVTLGAVGCCATAITWQYLVFGILAGAAFAAFLIVLAILSPAVG